MTPVIVSLVKEGLERPAQKVQQVTVLPRRTYARSDELVVEDVEPGPTGEPEPTGYSVYAARKNPWRIAIITGLLAFVVAVAALTLPELVAGRSVVSGGKKTTIFRGHRQPSSTTEQKTETTPQQTTTTPTDQQQTTTTPATPTETAPTTTTPPPAQTVPPAQTAPPDQQQQQQPPPPTTQPAPAP